MNVDELWDHFICEKMVMSWFHRRFDISVSSIRGDDVSCDVRLLVRIITNYYAHGL